MPLIATLVSHPASRTVSASLANMASRSVGASAVRWLGDGVACDLVLAEGAEAGETTAALRAALASEPVDVIVQQGFQRPLTLSRIRKILAASTLPGLVKEMLGAGAIFPALKPVPK